MSRTRQRRDSLGAIHTLRALAERRAQSASLLAQRDRNAALAQQDAEQAALVTAVDGWQAFLSTGRFAPELAISWGGAVNQQVERLTAAGTALGQENARLEAAQSVQRTAQAERKVADQLWRQAQRRHAAWREERDLAERDDTVTRRRWHEGAAS